MSDDIMACIKGCVEGKPKKKKGHSNSKWHRFLATCLKEEVREGDKDGARSAMNRCAEKYKRQKNEDEMVAKVEAERATRKAEQPTARRNPKKAGKKAKPVPSEQ